MKFDAVTPSIIKLCADAHLSFPQKALALQSAVDKSSTEEIIQHLDFGGVIPECFGHDSTEEKLFAKYCDALLARALQEIGLKSECIAERADAADVLAECAGYSLVGDAKAFRLSRTAKNQKDFKVEALNMWRKGADYACLVGPLYQYPKDRSQIYSQAARFNVTVLSYTHLVFLIRNKFKNAIELKQLWEVAKGLSGGETGIAYWAAVDTIILKLTGSKKEQWQDAQVRALRLLPVQAKEQILYLENEKKRIEKLPHDVAVKALIKALKIDSKIRAIRKATDIAP